MDAADPQYDNMSKLDRKPLEKSLKSLALKQGQNKPPIRQSDEVLKLAGFLKPLLNITLDALHEILLFLEPVDLLNLFRASKSFYRMLSAPGYRHVWAAARQNHLVPVPSPPPPLSEPKWASLLFERYCHACFLTFSSADTRVFHMLPEIGYTFCDPCFRVNTRPFRELRPRYGGKYANTIGWLVPPVRPTSYSDVLELASSASQPTTRYFVQEFAVVSSQYREAEGKGDASLKMFVDARTTYVEAALQSVKALRAWDIERREVRKRNRRAALERRSKSIKEKLYELGFTDDDIPQPDEHGQYRSVWRTAFSSGGDLTSSSWNRLRPKLRKAIYAERRAARLEKRKEELKQLWTAWMYSVPRDIAREYPSYESLLSDQAVLDVLSENDGTVPMTEDRFSARVAPIMRGHYMRYMAALVSLYA